MGCDIHAYIETKENGQWKYFDWRKEYQNGEYEDGSPSYDYSKMFDNPLYIHRNYDLFAILANVRNGRGFAGVLTGTGFKPISLPRDLPEDVTAEVKRESDTWGCDGHSHSWLLIKELLSYDWEGQTTTQYGVVGEEEYRQFKQSGKPESWAEDTWGHHVVKVSNAEMDQILSGQLEREPDKSYHTAVQWQEPYKQAVGKYWFNTLDELAKLGKPEDVRLVFWFDN